MADHQLNRSISNVFGGEDQSTANQKKNNYNRSDIFNLGGAPQTPPASVGKKAYNKKDNDIFGIRERATGEKTEVNETQLQSSVKPAAN